MTGSPQVLNIFSPVKGGRVTFGDGAQGRIKWVGNIEKLEDPQFVNVYYVEGLRENLISISQLCDERLKSFLLK